MWKLLVFSPEVLALLLFFELGLPWYRRTKYFPILRTVLYVVSIPFRKPKLIASAEERLVQARHRLEAAKADRSAAQLEVQAESLENETNNIREGKE